MSVPQDLQIIHTWHAGDFWFLFEDYHEKPYHASSHCYRLSASETKGELDEYRGLWGGCINGDILQPIFDSTNKALDRNPINKIVCVGLGSPSLLRLVPKAEARTDATKTWFTGTGTHHRMCNEPIHKLIFLEYVKATLLPRHDIKEICFHDPGFNQDDKEFIEKLEYSVIEDPEARNWMTKDTFLFAPSAIKNIITEKGKFLAPSSNAGLIARCLKHGLPALYIGTDPELVVSALDYWLGLTEIELTEMGPTEMELTDMELTDMKQTFTAFSEATRGTSGPIGLGRFDGEIWERFGTIRWPK